jgi:hypothetical protein
MSNLYTKTNVCGITDCVFTGAAILRKDKGAYRTTSIAAVAEDMSMVEPYAKGVRGVRRLNGSC